MDRWKVRRTEGWRDGRTDGRSDAISGCLLLIFFKLFKSGGFEDQLLRCIFKVGGFEDQTLGYIFKFGGVEDQFGLYFKVVGFMFGFDFHCFS